MTDRHDRTTIYTTDAGEEMSFAQIAMAAAKDPGVTVEDHPDGYLVDGEVFRPVDDFDTTDEYPVPPVNLDYTFDGVDDQEADGG